MYFVFYVLNARVWKLNSMKTSTQPNHTISLLSTLLEGQSKKMAFTHHQKFIIMDCPKENGEGKELLAFIGGIDLTEGRWDNQKHPLFRTLRSLHRDDFYGKCFHTSKEDGPRQVSYFMFVSNFFLMKLLTTDVSCITIT